MKLNYMILLAGLFLLLPVALGQGQDFPPLPSSNDTIPNPPTELLSTPPLPPDNSEKCTESWQCAEWSSCQNQSQSRACTEANKCETAKAMPETERSCTSQNTTNTTRILASKVESKKPARNGSINEILSPFLMPFIIFTAIFVLIPALIVLIIKARRKNDGWKAAPSQAIRGKPLQGAQGKPAQASQQAGSAYTAADQPKSELEDYIGKSLAAGASKEEIRKDLLSVGWRPEQVDPLLAKR